MWQHIPLFQQKHPVGSTLVVPQIVPGDRPAEGTGRRNQTWPWVLKIFSNIFSNISHVNHTRRTSPQVSEQPFVDIGIHRLHIILEILGSDYLFMHIDIRVHQSCDLYVILICYQPFAFQRMQVSALPRTSCTVFCSAVQARDFKKEKPKSPSQGKVVNHPEKSWILSQFW